MLQLKKQNIVIIANAGKQKEHQNMRAGKNLRNRKD